MSAPTSPDFKSQRLHQLSQQLGLAPLPIAPPLTRPEQPPSFKTANDEAHAEDTLRRQRQINDNHHSGSLRKAFSSKKRAWDSKEISQALNDVVASGGSAGVAEALIAKLEQSGATVVNGPKVRSGLLSRKKSPDSAPQAIKVLVKAVENAEIEMVQILLPHADAVNVDAALPVAIRAGNLKMVELLLRYGASVAQTTEGQAAFRHACAAGGQGRLVALIMNSPGRPPLDKVSRGVIEASQAGCLPTVRELLAAGGDGNAENAAALKAAVALTRLDVALALVTSSKPPQQPGVNEAFLQLFSHQNMAPPDKLSMAEVLLLAGANGDEVANSLVQACKAEFVQMIQLLMAFQTSIEYQDAFALRDVIKRGRLAMVQLLLNSRSPLSPLLASECAEIIPKNMSPDSQRIILDMLLRRGATGKCLHEALIDAAEADDLETATLLLNPIFPGGTPVSREGKNTSGSQSMIFARHDVATVDYKAGHALQIAVTHVNALMVKLLLESKPNPETLAVVFPYTQRLPPEPRYEVTAAFLATGFTGPAVKSALQDAIDVPAADRDERLVGLFLSHKPDINFHGGTYIMAAVSHQDVQLLQALLAKGPSPQAAANALSTAMEILDPEVRLQIVKLLLGAGAGTATTLVSDSLISALQKNTKGTVDEAMISLLLKQGKADINHKGGVPVAHAIQSRNPSILDLILRHGSPTVDTLSRALRSFTSIPTSPGKVTKLESILSRCPPSMATDAISELLIHEVTTALKLPAGTRSFGLVKALLAAGANVNIQNGAVLQEAVRLADQHLVDMIFTSSTIKPTPPSLGHALPRAVMIGDPMDRLTFTQRLLHEGAPGHDVDEALVFAVKTYQEDISLVRTLIEKADTSDGEALQAAVQVGNMEAIEIILAKGALVEEALSQAFVNATMGSEEKRRRICELLLQAGVKGVVVADALMVAASESDLGFAALLLEHGADVDHKEGQAVIAACRAGAANIVTALISGPRGARPSTLSRGFQAATEIGDLKKREQMFSLLLKQGVRGDIVDSQLVSSARFVDKGMGLVKLLLHHGASVDYNSGEAVWTATRTAHLPTLELLVGARNVGGKHRKPCAETLTRALKAGMKISPDARIAVIDWLFQAGLPVNDEVHLALNKAVNEEAPDESLISLLLRNGASPLANDCQSFVDATKRLLPGVLDMFMKLDVPKSNVSWIFAGGFTHDSASAWFNRDGLEVARTLLRRGAEGNGPASALCTVIDMMGPETEALAMRFIEMFLETGVDVNYQRGQALQKAAARGDGVLIQKLLKGKPDSEAVSAAIPCIFALELSEEDALALIQLFTDYHCDGAALDVTVNYSDKEPILFQALSRYPRSITILEALLDAGYYHDQTATYAIYPDTDKEDVSLLLWALLQPQKRVSNSVIKTLIDRRADTNFSSSLSRTTPLMAAVMNGRTEPVMELLVAYADPTAQDYKNATPMTMASSLGGDSGKAIMRYLLKINPSINDGSLHTAAAHLDIDTVELLLDAGHEPDFPSPLHEGRSALAELVSHGGDQELNADREKAMEKIITILLKAGSDPTVQSYGRSVLLLALEGADPVPTTRTLLKCGLWKSVNSTSNQYKDKTFVYSPTQYLVHVLRQNRYTPDLVTLLKNNRAQDVYYAHKGPQPADACNLPADLADEEKQRRARLVRIADAEEDHSLMIRRAQELAAVQEQLYTKQADLEDSRTALRRRQEIEAARDRARVTDEVFAGELARDKARREAVLAHEARMLEAAITKADVDRNAEENRRRKMLEWDARENAAKVDHERNMRAIRVAEREDVERIDRTADLRITGRIVEQRRLVETQQKLAGQLQNGGMVGSGPVRRQIGYVTDVS